MKGQTSFFMKAILIVLSAILFTIVVYQFNNYFSKVIEDKESSKFRVNALNTLEKLVSSKDCLAYEKAPGNAIKSVLDRTKIETFSNIYKDIEPDCAKALDFDYSITVLQMGKQFQTYPGVEVKEEQCIPKNGLAVHSRSDAYLFVCDKDLSDPTVRQACCSNKEQDGNYPKSLSCTGGVQVYCRLYDCNQYIKSDAECEFFDPSTGEKACCVLNTCSAHPIMLDCFNINAPVDCKELKRKIHSWCGNAGTSSKVTIGQNIPVSEQSTTWNFSVSTGISSFSPEISVREKLELSLPVTVWVNETYSAEGIIFIEAVKGELEEFYSLLEDVCAKAKVGVETTLYKNIKFSNPVEKRGDQICMLDRCKLFSCPYNLVFENFDRFEKGEYFIKISYNSISNQISVSK